MGDASLRLFGGVFARGQAAAELDDAAWLRALLDVEVALARALARAGLVPDDAAEAVATAAVPSRISVAVLAAGAAKTGTPVSALVSELRRGLPPEAAEALHRGATSQDVIDSALMLMVKRSLGHVLADVAGAADRTAELAREHRGTVMLGRTLLQHAVPTTFGLKAAGWMWSLDDARARLGDVVRARLVVQLGGAAGTLAPLGDRGVAVARFMAAELGLGEPIVPWHTLRAPLLELAAACGLAAAALGKIARDVTLLAQSDVGELREPVLEGRGTSSTMPQKQNPVGSIATLGCTRRVPGLVATLLASAEQEHERAAGGWHAEWETLTDLLRLLGSAASLMREVLAGLDVNAPRMRANLDASLGLPFAERVHGELVPRLGRDVAESLVRDAVLRTEDGRAHLRDVLIRDPEIAPRLGSAGIAPDQIASWFDPMEYLGSSAAFIDRALAAHDALGRKS